MQAATMDRRRFMKRGGAIILAGLPVRARAQSAADTRPDWNRFRSSADYSSLINGISRMRAYADSTNARSWAYWSRMYEQLAPLGQPYFLAWNRGFLYRFERQLQAVAGNPRLRLPYWDCYGDPELPEEFTIPARWNSLYVPRCNSNVGPALSLAAFAPEVTNMQEGLPGAFETIIETLPHNAVHNLLGGPMATLRSPDDPVFWLHQANLDRLWAAWMRAGAGRQVPAPGEAYWSGQLDYADGQTQATALLRDSGALGYRYADETLPAVSPDKADAQSFPFAAPAPDFGSAMRGLAMFQPQLPRVIVPLQAIQVGSAASTARAIDASHIALASARGIVLAQSNVTVELALDANIGELLQRIFSPRLPAAGAVQQSLHIVLDDLKLLESGAGGGYYYALYLNLPPAADTALAQRRHLLGSLGAFEIAAARQRMQRGLAGSVRVAFAATGLQRQIGYAPLRDIALSFVRFNGANSAPSGDMISIGEVRLELSVAAAA